MTYTHNTHSPRSMCELLTMINQIPSSQLTKQAHIVGGSVSVVCGYTEEKKNRKKQKKNRL